MVNLRVIQSRQLFPQVLGVEFQFFHLCFLWLPVYQIGKFAARAMDIEKKRMGGVDGGMRGWEWGVR